MHPLKLRGHRGAPQEEVTIDARFPNPTRRPPRRRGNGVYPHLTHFRIRMKMNVPSMHRMLLTQSTNAASILLRLNI